MLEHGNKHDYFAVSVMKGSTIIGCVLRKFSRAFHFFLGHGGRVSSEVTGNRRLGKGL